MCILELKRRFSVLCTSPFLPLLARIIYVARAVANSLSLFLSLYLANPLWIGE